MNVDLPLSTRLIILASDFLSRHWLVSLEIFFILFLVLYAIAKLKITKFYFDWVILRLPVFGEIAKKINSARLARTLGSLIESGVPIVQGLQIVAGTLSNIHFYKSLFESASLVQKGAQLSQSIKNYPQLYPVMVSQMMEVGEETGTLGEILGKLADFYEEDISNVTKGLASIIEPILMVVIGAAVGFFAISMVQPMYSIMEGM
jgi:type IV pilus assembly protein PilC